MMVVVVISNDNILLLWFCFSEYFFIEPEVDIQKKNEWKLDNYW